MTLLGVELPMVTTSESCAKVFPAVSATDERREKAPLAAYVCVIFVVAWVLETGAVALPVAVVLASPKFHKNLTVVSPTGRFDAVRVNV